MNTDIQYFSRRRPEVAFENTNSVTRAAWRDTPARVSVSQSGAGHRLQALAAVVLTLSFHSLPASAADLKPETAQAWQEYIKAAEARNQKRLAQGSPFLSIDAAPAEAAKLRQGEILASPAAPNVPVKVPGGLIHDWTGAIFIPNASIREILRVTRDYARYDTVYTPNVVNAKPLDSSEWEDRFSMTVMNKSFFAKSALDSDYHSTFTRLDDQRWYSVTETTRVQEVAEFGSSSQNALPGGCGNWDHLSVAFTASPAMKSAMAESTLNLRRSPSSRDILHPSAMGAAESIVR